MANVRHSYVVSIYHPDPNGVDQSGLVPMKLLETLSNRAEGHNLDVALKSARALIEARGFAIRTINVTSQKKTRSKGPTTGTIASVVTPTNGKGAGRTMSENRLKRGLPPHAKK